MLQAILTDFCAWGRGQVLTTLDKRLGGFALPADSTIPLSHEEYSGILSELLSKCDAALIIAPETDGILAQLTALAERAGIRLLGTSSQGVAIAGDKWECYQRFREHGLPTPATWRMSPAETLGAAKQIGFPLVIKPIAKAGCEGVALVADVIMLESLLERAEFQAQDILLQPYVSGTPASVSILASRREVLPLSLNQQLVSIGAPFVYQGGVVPLEHPLYCRALELARRAVSLLPGARGYLGVDMILTDRECYLLEINPRLTTSYVGLRQAVKINLAEAIWGACQENVLPQKVVISGKVQFSKEKFRVQWCAENSRVGYRRCSDQGRCTPLAKETDTGSAGRHSPF